LTLSTEDVFDLVRERGRITRVQSHKFTLEVHSDEFCIGVDQCPCPLTLDDVRACSTRQLQGCRKCS